MTASVSVIECTWSVVHRNTPNCIFDMHCHYCGDKYNALNQMFTKVNTSDLNRMKIYLFLQKMYMDFVSKQIK